MKTLTFDEKEERVLMAILDAAARHGGLELANPVAVWLAKVQGAEESKKLKAVAEK